MWKQIFRLQKHFKPITAVSIRCDEKVFVTASKDESVGVYYFDSKDFKYLRAHSSSVTDVAFSSNGDVFASTDYEGSIILWSSNNLEKKTKITQNNKSPITGISWSESYENFVVGFQQSAIIWSINNLEPYFTISNLQGNVRSLQWHDNLIAIAGDFSNILIFDYRSGTIVQSFQGKKFNCVSFNNDGTFLAGSEYDKIKIWDLRNCSNLNTLYEHSDLITKIGFNPKTNDILSISKNGTSRIWNVFSEEPMRSFHHKKAVNGFCWYPKSYGFITVGDEKKIRGYKYKFPDEIDFGGEEFMSSIYQMQRTLGNITKTMKSLDERLILQEERVMRLKDTNLRITKAYKKSLEK
ncbi:putative WD repeat-containing protein [Histomonas meleagridis]|uniref:putative WD repeat-containing protein n=1 Tax=Histomonas meleagridis TaxID=135588 RepID=UPI0035596DD8|nr:putative WD repeat-containing protein [Histomonas meleagridis]KAH0798991.1 putative WD repeat-containing protein [Histomonas meleagridis]